MFLKKNTNKELLVLVLCNDKNKKWFTDNIGQFERFFSIKFTFDKPGNIKNHIKDSVDILILDEPSLFEVDFYHGFQLNNPSFLFIALVNTITTNDIKIFKDDFADSIIYSGYGDKHLEWSLMAIFRRYWNTYSKPSTIIYKGIIADFAESHFIVNKQEVSLTPKEQKILKLLLESKTKFISKQRIFSDIWGHDDIDSTRTVDQTVFKLKKKIGERYFTFVRKKGIKLE